jgi:hypothetical protein
MVRSNKSISFMRKVRGVSSIFAAGLYSGAKRFTHFFFAMMSLLQKSRLEGLEFNNR